MPYIKPGGQKGFVMVIALIMLLAVTLMVVAAANLVQSNLKVVQNMESREMARSSALAAIEEAISSPRFKTNPDGLFLEPCEKANQKCYDYNGDGEVDVRVQLSLPRCITSPVLKNSELDVFANPSLRSCHTGAEQYSSCAEAIWEMEAIATDEVTGAEVVVRQGVSIDSTLSELGTACPL